MHVEAYALRLNKIIASDGPEALRLLVYIVVGFVYHVAHRLPTTTNDAGAAHSSGKDETSL